MSRRKQPRKVRVPKPPAPTPRTPDDSPENPGGRPNAIGAEQTPAHASGQEPPRWRGQDVVIAERRVKALDLRKGGATYRQIATHLGVSLETAYHDVQAEMQALRELATQGAEDVRDLERMRLDRYLVTLTQIAENANRTPLERTKAIAVLVRIQERRARLEGYDAPKKVEHSGRIDGTTELTAVDLDALSEEQLVKLLEVVQAQERAAQAAATS